ncbi:MAG: cbb3-type cytochrome c oxidase subunit I [Rhodospirillales bacterium]
MADVEPARHKTPASFGASERNNLLAWSLLGVGVLAVAGVMALLIAVSRIPGIEKLSIWPIDFFHRGLVIHVIFSFIVWFFAVFGALLSYGTASERPKNGLAGKTGVWLAVIACLLLAVSAFSGDGVASLNNYVPVIIDPVFYAGLLVLGLALILQIVCFVAGIGAHGRARPPLVTMTGIAAIVFVIAAVCLIQAYFLGRGEALDEAYNEQLFWGFGHILQFMNVALLIGAWAYLAEDCGHPIPHAAITVAGALLVLAALAGPLFYGSFEPFSASQTLAFTNLQYAMAPPSVLVAFLVCMALWRGRHSHPRRNPAFLGLSLSIAVFGIGGFLGLFVDGADTRTPAHYHGVIAGINLAFMGLYYALFLPALNKSIEMTKTIYAQFILFAGGQTFAAIGLFWAGGYGAPRKVAGADQGLSAIGGYIGMFMNGIGALIAIIGGVMFIWTIARALLKKSR